MNSSDNFRTLLARNVRMVPALQSALRYAFAKRLTAAQQSSISLRVGWSSMARVARRMTGIDLALPGGVRRQQKDEKRALGLKQLEGGNSRLVFLCIHQTAKLGRQHPVYKWLGR